MNSIAPVMTALDAMILNAIKEQLTQGWQTANGVWWPLLLGNGSEVYICGDTVMSADDFSRYAHARLS